MTNPSLILFLHNNLYHVAYRVQKKIYAPNVQSGPISVRKPCKNNFMSEVSKPVHFLLKSQAKQVYALTLKSGPISVKK